MYGADCLFRDAHAGGKALMSETNVQESPRIVVGVDRSPAAKAAMQWAACLVVASRGHGGLAGAMLGSVSSAVAAHAQCPVVVVHEGD